MAYSATLANSRKLITDEEHRRLLSLFSRAGLSMDHHQFDEETLAKATAAILKTRDGLLRAAVPSPIGSCVFLNDVSAEEMNAALRRHKEIMKDYPRNGEGLEAYVDSSDTGYTENAKVEEERIVEAAARKAGNLNGPNGHVDAGIDGVCEGSARFNGKVTGSAALSNATTGNAIKSSA
jgi:3-dehydroquinate synthase